MSRSYPGRLIPSGAERARELRSHDRIHRSVGALSTVSPRCDDAVMSSDEAWVCMCRRCCGVLTGADAVQYVWEFALGSCGVPTVVGVNADLGGFVCCAFTYWHGEPAEPHPIGDLGEFIVSCRPGEGTVPTEGDIARWVAWESGPRPPRDWLVVDGKRFRSVSATVDALRRRSPMPDERTIAGDWFGDGLDPAFRAEVREIWSETKRRIHATSEF
jgi:hypothetical protein